jgi:hypothetical protein
MQAMARTVDRMAIALGLTKSLAGGSHLLAGLFRALHHLPAVAATAQTQQYQQLDVSDAAAARVIQAQPLSLRLTCALAAEPHLTSPPPGPEPNFAAPAVPKPNPPACWPPPWPPPWPNMLLR